ncbi:nucleolar MIF4G domain-containing protein 1-like isoform X3 [Anneissia japonica]|uniref:nucleolar MIF4G domain-containing protein 1-like isoform X3 n=1 Tax=Anneissia japonica TaxID=1529436 RepID=UPI0014255920|nr:nucleolar MIF4G domain-containing protein 1-like isoform X3 [Anneissia japonica]
MKINKKQQPQNLKRYKKSVIKLLEKNDKDDQTESNLRDPRLRKKVGKSRKDKRREAKKLKKAKIHAFHSKHKIQSTEKKSEELQSIKKKGKKKKESGSKDLNSKKKEKAELLKRTHLLEQNKKEEMLIKKLEKSLKFRKKKKTKEKLLPMVFKQDGLDYLLDVCDSEKMKSFEESDLESDDEMDDECVLQSLDQSDDDSNDEHNFLDESLEKDSKRIKKNKQLVKNLEYKESEKTDKTSSDEITDDEFDFSDNDDTEHVNDCADEDVEHLKSLPKMDPYGNVIGETKSTKVASGTYIPPQKRAQLMGESSQKKLELEKLRKQVKGLINRLSEANLQWICSQVEDLYLKNSRNDMNETLTGIILEACVTPSLTPERLVLEHVLLVAILHSSVGSEVGAHFITSVARQFSTLYSSGGNYGIGKQCDNVLLVVSHLCNFKVVHCTFMYDIIKKLVKSFTERDIEMLLLVIRSCGMSLRKDDPTALKDIILEITTQANSCSQEFKEQSRVKFMLEILTAVRNNNLRKIPGYDAEHLEHLKKLLKGIGKGSSAENMLTISLEDLLSADVNGRWWVVGSAWTGRQSSHDQNSSTDVINKEVNQMSSKIMELSRQQRMNTDVRKTIFAVIMTAEDYVDSFEKLLRLGLKSGQEREIVHVIVDCCLQERVFNPYYAHLAAKFSLYDRKYRMGLQFAFWDKFKMLEQQSTHATNNLALLIVHLLVAKAMSISVLKVVEFSEMDKPMVRFLRKILTSLLMENSDETITTVLGSLTAFPKFNLLREGLRIFLFHFLRKGREKNIQDDVMWQKMKIAEQALLGNAMNIQL